MLAGFGIAEAGRRWQCLNGQCSIQQTTTQYSTAPANAAAANTAPAKNPEAKQQPAKRASSLLGGPPMGDHSFNEYGVLIRTDESGPGVVFNAYELRDDVRRHASAINDLFDRIEKLEGQIKKLESTACKCQENLNATATDSASWQMLKAHDHQEPEPVQTPVLHAVEAIDSFVANLTHPHDDCGWSAMKSE